MRTGPLVAEATVAATRSAMPLGLRMTPGGSDDAMATAAGRRAVEKKKEKKEKKGG